MIRPSREEAKNLAKHGTIVPIALEILSDRKTPIEVLRNIKQQSSDWFILESVNGGDGWGRYSFLGHNPFMSIFGSGDTVTIKTETNEISNKQDALEAIRKLISRYKSPSIPYLPPFTGGFIGYFAYDFAKHLVPGLAINASDENNFHDFHLMLIDKVIAFDHFRQKIYLIVNIATENIDDNYTAGIAELQDIEKMILKTSADIEEAPSVCGEFSSLFTSESWKSVVEKVQHHIMEGDIFQAVISNRFKAPFEGSLMNTYRLLRTTNPSPYMVHMRLGDTEIACASPETLVSCRNGEISSFPLAGTCLRGKTEEEDAALTEALLHDEKELAEHDMLVDLARNDIGKVSQFGSVTVREYRQIKKFSHVSHISSRVTGKLKEGADALDAIAATLPSGTLSGAPKKRACEIIDAAEKTKRGVYGGALGYIDFAGNMDMCIGIRMAVLKGGNVFVQAGSGIVADSIPEKEYLETNNKARAVMDALKNSGEVY